MMTLKQIEAMIDSLEESRKRHEVAGDKSASKRLSDDASLHFLGAALINAQIKALSAAHKVTLNEKIHGV